jgi:hypothetical protein
MRLEETSVAQLFSTSCMVDLATSECFSNKKKSHFLNYSNPHVNYDNAPHLRADDILLTLRFLDFWLCSPERGRLEVIESHNEMGVVPGAACYGNLPRPTAYGGP